MATSAAKSWDRRYHDGAYPKRSLARAMRRGFRGRCPSCGEGRLFAGYLRPRAACPHCDENLSHQRADDAPPYFTILVVGHIVVPIMVSVALATDFALWLHLAFWLPLTAALTLSLLRPIKGAIIGLQWALYMHGFDPAERDEDDVTPFEDAPAPVV